jgi:hypothetical protein
MRQRVPYILGDYLRCYTVCPRARLLLKALHFFRIFGFLFWRKIPPLSSFLRQFHPISQSFFFNSPDNVPCFVIFYLRVGLSYILSCIFSGLKWTSLNMKKHLSDPNQHLDKFWLTSKNPNVNS